MKSALQVYPEQSKGLHSTPGILLIICQIIKSLGIFSFQNPFMHCRNSSGKQAPPWLQQFLQ
jgi:hypothetical protein